MTAAALIEPELAIRRMAAGDAHALDELLAGLALALREHDDDEDAARVQLLHHGDEQALAELCTKYETFIRWVARRRGVYRLPVDMRDDLQQSGRLGLIEAARRADSSRGNFLSYAASFIFSSIIATVNQRLAVVPSLALRRRADYIAVTTEALDRPARDDEALGRATRHQDELTDHDTPEAWLTAIEAVEARLRALRLRSRITGAAIRASRTRAGIKQKDLARQVGISPSHLAAVEAGHDALSPAAADRMLAVLGDALLTPHEVVHILAEERERDLEHERLLAVLTPAAIRAARTELGLTSTQVAVQLGKSPGGGAATIRLWEHGKAHPNLHDARRLHELLAGGVCSSASPASQE